MIIEDSLTCMGGPLPVSLPVFAQDISAKQDMKTPLRRLNAAKDTGHGIKQGTTKSYDKTANGMKTVADKMVDGTKTGAKDDVSKDA
jgi:hypothetical protein